MDQLKNIIKITPLISAIYSILRSGERALRKKYNPFRKKSTEDVFTDIYKANAWVGLTQLRAPDLTPAKPE